MSAVFNIPASLDLVAQLTDVPDALHARLSAFLRSPDGDTALDLARDLEGARVAVMRVRQALEQEASYPGARDEQ